MIVYYNMDIKMNELLPHLSEVLYKHTYNIDVVDVLNACPVHMLVSKYFCLNGPPNFLCCHQFEEF